MKSHFQPQAPILNSNEIKELVAQSLSNVRSETKEEELSLNANARK